MKNIGKNQNKNKSQDDAPDDSSIDLNNNNTSSPSKSLSCSVESIKQNGNKDKNNNKNNINKPKINKFAQGMGAFIADEAEISDDGFDESTDGENDEIDNNPENFEYDLRSSFVNDATQRPNTSLRKHYQHAGRRKSPKKLFGRMKLDFFEKEEEEIGTYYDDNNEWDDIEGYEDSNDSIIDCKLSSQDSQDDDNEDDDDLSQSVDYNASKV